MPLACQRCHKIEHQTSTSFHWNMWKGHSLDAGTRDLIWIRSDEHPAAIAARIEQKKIFTTAILYISGLTT